MLMETPSEMKDVLLSTTSQYDNPLFCFPGLPNWPQCLLGGESIHGESTCAPWDLDFPRCLAGQTISSQKDST